jgi:hypothetical protein
MLRLTAFALLLFLLALPVPALGQEGDAPLAEDGEDDVHLTVQGTQGPAAASAYPAVDLVALRLLEEPTTFTWMLEVADLRGGAEETGADGVTYALDFTHNGRQFRLDLRITLPVLNSGFVFPSLQARDSPDAEWAPVWGDPRAVSIDLAGDVISVVLPREVLADAGGAVPYPSRSLEAVSVASRSTLSDARLGLGVTEVPVPMTVGDQMPDAGEPLPSFAVQLGVRQDGNARLWSATPFRASNGEATTYVYDVTAANLGPDRDVMELVAVGVPAKLTVVLPVPLVVLDGNGTQDVPVLVTVPFGHDHGSAAKFTLELRSQNDPGSVGRLEMGVRFLAVPQPAGHHDTVYLHSSQGAGTGSGLTSFEMGYMNTLETDDNDALRPMHATGLSQSFNEDMQPEYRYSWMYVLGPALEMGLDTDLTRTGAFAIPVRSTFPMLATSMQAYVTVQEDLFFGPGFGGEEVVIAASAPTAAVDLMPNAVHVFEGELVPDPSGDEVPYVVGRNMYLFIEVATLGPLPTLGFAEESAAITPGGWLRLPLNEWHDPVDDALASLDGPALSSIESQERRVNPGEAIVFHVEVENPTDRTLSMRFEVTGSNAEWASLPDGGFALPPGAIGNVTVVVRAPEGAVHGERADLILQAYPTKNPAARGLLRLVAIVDTSEDLPDEAVEAKRLGAPKDTPAPGFLAVACALAAFAASRRRWR